MSERSSKHAKATPLVELAIGAPDQKVVAQAIDSACHGTHDQTGVSPCINWKMETGEIGCSRDRVKRSPIRGWQVTVGVLNQLPSVRGGTCWGCRRQAGMQKHQPYRLRNRC